MHQATGSGYGRAPRIAISQAEITADLNHRGGEPRRPGAMVSLDRVRR